MVQLSHPYMTIGKTLALTIWTFVSKVMTLLGSILKSRDITLPMKFCLVKAMVFPVVVYGCESWTIKLSAKELMPLNYGAGEDS